MTTSTQTTFDFRRAGKYHKKCLNTGCIISAAKVRDKWKYSAWLKDDTCLGVENSPEAAEKLLIDYYIKTQSA